jgi:TRAP-type mannitol/chloroaromatic compound transport system permease small subunit
MNAATEQTPNKFCDALDGFIRRIGHAASWLNGFLVVVIIVQVILRYVFGKGLVVMEELQWHLYAIAIMIGFSYDVVADSHIRLDLLHDRFPKRRKEKVEIFGILFLLMPMLIVILYHSWDFLYDSLRINESSDAPMGLCCRWFIKAFIPIGFGMLALAAVSRLIRAITFLKLGKDA